MCGLMEAMGTDGESSSLQRITCLHSEGVPLAGV